MALPHPLLVGPVVAEVERAASAHLGPWALRGFAGHGRGGTGRVRLTPMTDWATISSLPREAQLGYLAAAVIVVVGGLCLLAYLYVHHELRPAPRPSPVFVRRRPRPAPPAEPSLDGSDEFDDLD
jgi:hypothetical protein